MTGDQPPQHLIRSYMDAIKRNATVAYVWSFAMFDASEHLIHWLIFSTNHLRGLEVMKAAMWKADQAGEYRFSDRVDDSGQQSFFSTLGADYLADDLEKRLAGRTLREDDVRAFVLTETPFHLYKTAVNMLRTRGAATPAQKGKFPVTFAAKR